MDEGIHAVAAYPSFRNVILSAGQRFTALEGLTVREFVEGAPLSKDELESLVETCRLLPGNLVLLVLNIVDVAETGALLEATQLSKTIVMVPAAYPEPLTEAEVAYGITCLMGGLAAGVYVIWGVMCSAFTNYLRLTRRIN